MATVEINPVSTLNLTELLDYKGVAFWDETVIPEIPDSDQDVYLRLSRNQAKRIDLLAYDFYGSSELMWVILAANNVDLPNQFVENQVIRIPPRETVDQILELTKERQRTF